VGINTIKAVFIKHLYSTYSTSSVTLSIHELGIIPTNEEIKARGVKKTRLKSKWFSQAPEPWLHCLSINISYMTWVAGALEKWKK
jgi:hypothetical protein